MSEFKITPEDVGRVAITDDAFKTEFRLVHVTEHGAVFEEIETFALYTFNLRGERTDGVKITERPTLTGWKPVLLEAPKRWWTVFRTPSGQLDYQVWDDYEASTTYSRDGMGSPIARVYDHHWHGCEEGRFDTPESIGEAA